MKGKTAAEIRAELDSVNGDAAPSFTNVKTWAVESKHGRTSIFDGEHFRLRKIATADEIIDYVHEIVTNHRRITLRAIAKIIGISYERDYLECDRFGETKACL